MSKIIWFHTYPQRLRCQDDKTLKQRGWWAFKPKYSAPFLIKIFQPNPNTTPNKNRIFMGVSGISIHVKSDMQLIHTFICNHSLIGTVKSWIWHRALHNVRGQRGQNAFCILLVEFFPKCCNVTANVTCQRKDGLIHWKEGGEGSH